MDLKRLETARLFHRFAFGPRPGEFRRALESGILNTRKELLTPSTNDQGAAKVSDPVLRDLGQRPAPNSREVVAFATEMRKQNIEIVLWWLDRMALTDNALTEKMTWFWHGHWATSIEKLNFALPMYRQNLTLRANALGNFKTMAKAMINDGALQFWLDGNENTASAPNENLAREFMELFVIGVNRYSEDDVKALSRALTGYQVTRSNGDCRFNPRRHDNSPVTILGKTALYNGESASDYLVSQENCALFISERLWYRFISSSVALPANSSIQKSFADREISATLTTLASSEAMSDPANSIVKSPVEWFIAVCRALNLQPSKLSNPILLLAYLDKLSQRPFYPPNVSGWPSDEAWLSAASAQFRIGFANWLVKQADLTEVNSLKPVERIPAIADLLGIVEFSSRTLRALSPAKNDPARLLLLAVCSPEYIVSA